MVAITALSLLLVGSFGGERPVSLPDLQGLTVSQVSAFLVIDQRVVREIGGTKAQQEAWSKAYQSHFDREQEIIQKWQKGHSEADAIDEGPIIENDQKFAAEALQGVSPAQASRLLEIAFQVLGPSALARRDVADKLKLSASQREAIADLVEKIADVRDQPAERFALRYDQLKPKENPTPDERQRYQIAYQEMLKASATEESASRKAAESLEIRILSLLEDKQKALWSRWIGKNFAPAHPTG